MLTDTHCHLDKIGDFNTIKTELVKTKNVGIENIIIPTINEQNFNDVLHLNKLNKLNKLNESKNIEIPKLYFAVGIHPFYATNNINIKKSLENLHNFYLQNTKKIIAVGEIGLDFYDKNKYKNKYNIPQMKLLFEEQLKFAKEYNLPIIIHCRKAFNDIIERVKKIGISRGIFHAFNGSLEIAKIIIKNGFYLGFGGAITYEKATKLRRLLTQISCQNIVLETDAPYMQPAWINKTINNTPSQLFDIAKCIANIKNIPLQTLAEITTNNAKTALAL